MVEDIGTDVFPENIQARSEITHSTLFFEYIAIEHGYKIKFNWLFNCKFQ